MVLFLSQANDFSELFVSHNTWTGYFTMLRVAKEYDLPVRDAHGTVVTARKTLFPGRSPNLSTGYGCVSCHYRIVRWLIMTTLNVYIYVVLNSLSMTPPGYFGTLSSTDDFYVLSSGLVVQETTNRFD